MFCVLSPVQLPNNSGAVPPKKNFYRVRIIFFSDKNILSFSVKIWHLAQGPDGK